MSCQRKLPPPKEWNNGRQRRKKRQGETEEVTGEELEIGFDTEIEDQGRTGRADRPAEVAEKVEEQDNVSCRAVIRSPAEASGSQASSQPLATHHIFSGSIDLLSYSGQADLDKGGSAA